MAEVLDDGESSSTFLYISNKRNHKVGWSRNTPFLGLDIVDV